jgi:hypothetical protein
MAKPKDDNEEITEEERIKRERLRLGALDFVIELEVPEELALQRAAARKFDP